LFDIVASGLGVGLGIVLMPVFKSIVPPLPNVTVSPFLVGFAVCVAYLVAFGLGVAMPEDFFFGPAGPIGLAFARWSFGKLKFGTLVGIGAGTGCPGTRFGLYSAKGTGVPRSLTVGRLVGFFLPEPIGLGASGFIAITSFCPSS